MVNCLNAENSRCVQLRVNIRAYIFSLCALALQSSILLLLLLLLLHHLLIIITKHTPYNILVQWKGWHWMIYQWTFKTCTISWRVILITRLTRGAWVQCAYFCKPKWIYNIKDQRIAKIIMTTIMHTYSYVFCKLKRESGVRVLIN